LRRNWDLAWYSEAWRPVVMAGLVPAIHVFDSTL
jgi:hypothetical protein